MTVKGGTSQACAACKYQRRKCSADCPLAPYFPPEQPKLFQNAHHLFGVSNILKILNKIEPSQKSEAMRSIVYEANVRERFPANGCLGLILALHFQIQHAQMELDAINAQLAIHRHRSLQLVSSPSSSSSSNTSGANYLPFDAPSTVISIAEKSINNNNNNDDDGKIEDFWNGGTCNSMIAVAAAAAAAAAAGMYPPFEMISDEISPYFHTTGDEEQAYESSSESSLKDTVLPLSMENVSEDELKTAAACFTLTSYHQRHELIE